MREEQYSVPSGVLNFKDQVHASRALSKKQNSPQQWPSLNPIFLRQRSFLDLTKTYT